MNRVILFAAQIKRLFPPRWTLVLLICRAVLRGLVKLNRCVRSLKLYVVANTHAYLPRDIHARGSASIRESLVFSGLKRLFRRDCPESTSFITLLGDFAFSSPRCTYEIVLIFGSAEIFLFFSLSLTFSLPFFYLPPPPL